MNTSTINRTEVTNNTTTKPRRKRGIRLPLSAMDGNTNTKLVATDAMEQVRRGYARLLRILNGSVVRTLDDGTKVKYPLEQLSDARRKWIEDQLAAMHETTFSQLEAGHRNVTASPSMPD